MNVEFVGLEALKADGKIKDDDEVIIFYETDPDLDERFGFEPASIGLKVFTVGYYPMRESDFLDGPEEDEPGSTPTWCLILGTTRKWLDEAQYLYELDKDFR